MVANNNVIPFRGPRQYGGTSEGETLVIEGSSLPTEVRGELTLIGGSVSAVKLEPLPQRETLDVLATTFDQLYPEARNFRRAYELTRRHQTELADAREGTPLDRDSAIDVLKADLPEMFMARDMSDGWRALVSSLKAALSNRNGLPLSEAQYDIVHFVVRRLAEAPKLQMQRALPLIDALEETGLNVDPSLLATISSFLTDEVDD